MKLSERERIKAPNWNPYQKFVWTRKQLLAWIDGYGTWSFYDGEAWSIGNRKVAPDRFEIWFYKLPC